MSRYVAPVRRSSLTLARASRRVMESRAECVPHEGMTGETLPAVSSTHASLAAVRNSPGLILTNAILASIGDVAYFFSSAGTVLNPKFDFSIHYVRGDECPCPHDRGTPHDALPDHQCKRTARSP